MRKCKLINYTVSYKDYKGETYMRATLIFEIFILGIIRYNKSITYDVTMFSDFKSYTDNWDMVIKKGSPVKYSIIKDNIIFN